MMTFSKTTLAVALLALTPLTALEAGASDTGQDRCYNSQKEIRCPDPGQPFFGQDAQYRTGEPNYRDNGDGTVTDLQTGLMWSQGVDARKVTLEDAEQLARQLSLGGYSDWRVPTIKELFSLIDFRGYTGFSSRRDLSSIPGNAIPYINTDFFGFAYGDTRSGERYIDGQWLSRTEYIGTTMNGARTLFGVNFADGRIKGYAYRRPGSPRDNKTFFVRFVRGTPYGDNDFTENGDGTVTDRSTGLTWMQTDSGRGLTWEEALAYAENLQYAGYDDWRLPNAKELHYIVDYSRSPDTSGTAAIDPIFRTTRIINEAGQADFPFFWTSTTHLDGPTPGQHAAYVAFGRAIGQMHGQTMDVHGAGSQRSDPKTGQARLGHGPQGDAQRVLNYVRVVRGGALQTETPKTTVPSAYPNKVRVLDIRVENVRSHQRNNQQPAYGGEQRQQRGQRGGPPQKKGGFVTRLDRDGDGQVSRREFDGPAYHFDKLDRNRDGYLSEDEAPPFPPGQRGRP